MTEAKLFSSLTVGDLTLPNRIVMAPMTRNRAAPEGDLPQAMHADYYAQRASAGLIITEATQISPEGKGYAQTPGIYSAAQVGAWRHVTDAVHAAGGRIFAQLWHVGRISHVSMQPDGQAPVAPSAIAAGAKTFDGTGFVDTSTPRALETFELARVVDDFRAAARNAVAAGFDGVEIHGANGYLLDQFLADGSNHRDDAYGGSVENRMRLLSEVVEAVTAVVGAGRTGVRLSPLAGAQGAVASDPMAQFGPVVDMLDRVGIAYLHMIEGSAGSPRADDTVASVQALRRRFSGVYIANNGYDRELAIEAVASGEADLVAFGVPFIANPDLVERLRRDAALNLPDKATFYGGGTEGYTDYPTLTASQAA